MVDADQATRADLLAQLWEVVEERDELRDRVACLEQELDAVTGDSDRGPRGAQTLTHPRRPAHHLPTSDRDPMTNLEPLRAELDTAAEHARTHLTDLEIPPGIMPGVVDNVFTRIAQVTADNDPFLAPSSAPMIDSAGDERYCMNTFDASPDELAAAAGYALVEVAHRVRLLNQAADEAAALIVLLDKARKVIYLQPQGRPCPPPASPV